MPFLRTASLGAALLAGCETVPIKTNCESTLYLGGFESPPAMWRGDCGGQEAAVLFTGYNGDEDAYLVFHLEGEEDSEYVSSNPVCLDADGYFETRAYGEKVRIGFSQVEEAGQTPETLYLTYGDLCADAPIDPSSY